MKDKGVWEGWKQKPWKKLARSFKAGSRSPLGRGSSICKGPTSRKHQIKVSGA